MIEMYTTLTKYDAEVIRVYGSTTRGNVFTLDKGRAKCDLPKYFTNRVRETVPSIKLGTVSLTMLYYLKLLTLLNCDLTNFGNIKI